MYYCRRWKNNPSKRCCCRIDFQFALLLWSHWWIRGGLNDKSRFCYWWLYWSPVNSITYSPSLSPITPPWHAPLLTVGLYGWLITCYYTLSNAVCLQSLRALEMISSLCSSLMFSSSRRYPSICAALRFMFLCLLSTNRFRLPSSTASRSRAAPLRPACSVC